MGPEIGLGYKSRQYFASTLREQLFELKNEDTINLRLSNHKSENLRVKYGWLGLSINTMHGPIQSRETVPLMLKKVILIFIFKLIDYCKQ